MRPSYPPVKLAWCTIRRRWHWPVPLDHAERVVPFTEAVLEWHSVTLSSTAAAVGLGAEGEGAEGEGENACG